MKCLKSKILFEKTKLLQEIKKEDYTHVVLFYDRKMVGIKLDLEKKLGKKFQVKAIPLKSAEATKDLREVLKLYDKLLAWNINRSSLFVAIGGGVIGDTVGFVASTYMRGVDWLNIPTTLLAQVDSAIGGKTAVNHKRGKNLIGTIYQPRWIYVDVKTLKTLPVRELTSGLGEIYKYAVGLDATFFQKLKNIDKMRLKDWQEIVKKCILLKTSVVEQDEKDRIGIRQKLNLGHTLGHALEKSYSGKLKHGEAVIWGLRFAAVVSYMRGYLKVSDYNKILDELFSLAVPKVDLSQEQKYWKYILTDKKNAGKQVRMVLLEGVGKSISNETISLPEYKAALRELRSLAL